MLFWSPRNRGSFAAAFLYYGLRRKWMSDKLIEHMITSVRRVVALITVLACVQIRARPVCCFTWLKPYFNISALIFYVCEESSQPTEPIKHANYYGIDIFDYEGHDL